MSLQIRPTEPADEAAIIAFLARVFGTEASAPFLSPALMRWKYWLPREDFDGPRAYLSERDRRIVAHVGLWPITIHEARGTRRGVHMIDWGADPAAPGAGVALMQFAAREFDFVFSIGGTGDTQRILPRLGFQVVAEAVTFARPLRPWRQAWRHQSRDWRLPARTLRNFWWSVSPFSVAPHGCEAAELDADTAGELRLSAQNRDAGFFRFLSRCPCARSLTFRLNHGGRDKGLLLLLADGEQARIGGLWLDSPGTDDWQSALQLARDTAVRHTSASELVYRTSAAECQAAALAAGLRIRARDPLFFLGKGGAAGLVLPEANLADDDAAFLFTGFRT